MSVWNKVLLGLVFVASLVFFHAALRTFRTFDYWSRKAADFDLKLATMHKDIIQLRTADHDNPLPNNTFGVQQLRFDLDRMLANRGRIWTNCLKKGNIAQDKDGPVEATVTCEEGNFSDKMLLYVFEEGDEQSPGKYLGEYRVKAINQSGQGSPSLVLVSTTQPTKTQVDDLKASKMPWVLYEMMPSDQLELFATLPVDLQKKFFPEPDPGLPKVAQDEWKEKKWWLPPLFVVNGKPFERKLNDYLEVFRACEVDRTLYEDRLNALKRDEGSLDAAKADSLEQEKFAEKEKSQAITDREWEAKQQKAVADHYAGLQTMLSNNEAENKNWIDRNIWYAQQIAKIQKDAAEQIDRRTRSMARNGASAN